MTRNTFLAVLGSLDVGGVVAGRSHAYTSVKAHAGYAGYSLFTLTADE